MVKFDELVVFFLVVFCYVIFFEYFDGFEGGGNGMGFFVVCGRNKEYFFGVFMMDFV